MHRAAGDWPRASSWPRPAGASRDTDQVGADGPFARIKPVDPGGDRDGSSSRHDPVDDLLMDEGIPRPGHPVMTDASPPEGAPVGPPRAATRRAVVATVALESAFPPLALAEAAALRRVTNIPPIWSLLSAADDPEPPAGPDGHQQRATYHSAGVLSSRGCRQLPTVRAQVDAPRLRAT